MPSFLKPMAKGAVAPILFLIFRPLLLLSGKICLHGVNIFWGHAHDFEDCVTQVAVVSKNDD